MGYWDFEKDSDRTCFNHLDKHVPDSIKKEAREELVRRGYSENTVREEEWQNSRSY